MKIVAQLSAFLFLVNCCGIQGVNTKKEQLAKKRNLWNFARMTYCITDRFPYDYVNYGCHCGWKGGGKILDEIDRCCYYHDLCYDDLVKKKLCSTWSVYYTSYSYECTKGVGTCSSKNKGCGRGLCECDLIAANCLKGKKYNKEMKNIDTKKMCGVDEDKKSSKKEKKRGEKKQKKKGMTKTA